LYLSAILASIVLAVSMVMLLPCAGFAQSEAEDDSGPVLLSVFPVGAQRGTTVQADIRGHRLDGATGVWCDKTGLKAQLVKVEEIKDDYKQKVNPLEKQKKPMPMYRAVVQVRVDGTAALGDYPLRLVSRRGISNPLGFPVVEQRVIVEAPGSHQDVQHAQPASVPGIITGKIGLPGELDYYSFHAQRGQELWFEAIQGNKLNPGFAPGKSQKFVPEVALYRAGGSWFDPHRPTRLLFEEERTSDLMRVQAQGTYKFPQDGEYFLEVSGLFGQGCPDCSYQVLISPPKKAPALLAEDQSKANSGWIERSLGRRLQQNWIEEVEARSVKTAQPAAAEKEASASQASGAGPNSAAESKQASKVPTHPAIVQERGSKAASGQPEVISVPSIVEGTIGHPGDFDTYKFKAEAGQKLAFEIQTPDAKPPIFNPRFGIVDGKDHELFSNVERRLSMFNNNADPQVYLKDVESKAIYTFERGGEYLLEVRDITSRYGAPNYRYRILVRPEIPHVGEISLMSGAGGDGTTDMATGQRVNHINLVRGHLKRLTVIASYEEGFSGDLSFTFSGLPAGVQSFPAIQYSETKGPLEVTQNPEIIAPKQQKATTVLLANPEAELTREPVMVQVYCRPIVNGTLGPNLLVQEVPLMVVEDVPQPQVEKMQAAAR
jgi:hypothetical protein